MYFHLLERKKQKQQKHIEYLVFLQKCEYPLWCNFHVSLMIYFLKIRGVENDMYDFQKPNVYLPNKPKKSNSLIASLAKKS